MLTQNQIKSILNYEPHSGVFRWRVDRPPQGRVGEMAGNDTGHGYWKISIHGERYYAHRLAFLWMTGEIPKEVDHINQCKSDNRWEDLRASNHSENLHNIVGRSGVRKRHGRWYARIRNPGQQRHIGVFDTKQEALAAYKAARIRNGFESDRLEPTPTKRLKKKARQTFKWRGKTLSEWSRITGIPQPTLYWRVFKKGIHPKIALGI